MPSNPPYSLFLTLTQRLTLTQETTVLHFVSLVRPLVYNFTHKLRKTGCHEPRLSTAFGPAHCTLVIRTYLQWCTAPASILGCLGKITLLPQGSGETHLENKRPLTLIILFQLLLVFFCWCQPTGKISVTLLVKFPMFCDAEGPIFSSTISLCPLISPLSVHVLQRSQFHRLVDKHFQIRVHPSRPIE